MKAFELKEGMYWVGAIDWAVRDFHGYVTPRGTSYNNYLIIDDEPTLIDTVKYDFAETAIRNIQSVINPGDIRHLIVNHIENDHASSLGRIVELTPGAVIYMTEKGKKGIDRFFDTSRWQVKIVKTGDTLKIGKRTLLFIETPMLHWPDSMMTYCVEDKVLFSQDAFGQHIASSARFDDQYAISYSDADLDDAVVDYYANILMPFGQLIKTKMAEFGKLGLELDMIAPDHGVIWRSNPQRVLSLYNDMAEGKARLRATIIYDTMWQSTALMADPIAEGVRSVGIECEILKLRATPMSVAIKEFWKSRGTLIGTPTLNNIMYPSVAEYLTHLRGLRPKNRLVGAFGSYGWSGGAVRDAYEDFKKMGLEVFEPGLQFLYKPSFDDEKACYEFGRQFGTRLNEFHASF